MTQFNNEEYQALVNDLIGDIFYSETSFRGKISTVRQYAEIIVRKILDIVPNEYMTLGKNEIKEKIKHLQNHEFLENALKTIRDEGNKCTHTQYLGNMTENDFERIMDSLFDMLAFLLIEYFEKYEFGSRSDVMRVFSILPPIIRYKVLKFLYKKYPNNIHIIDRLAMAIVKAYSIEEANSWVEQEKNRLVKLNSMSETFKNDIVKQLGLESEEILQNLFYNRNMYVLCKEKISLIGDQIKYKGGTLYSDFESALQYYKKYGILSEDSLEIKEFNDIMNFLYLGRKEKMKELSTENNTYMILNVLEKGRSV